MGIRREVADRLLRAATDAADPRDGVLSRADLRAMGVGRDRVSSHVRAGRWRLHGRHRVDGVTSLKAAGVTGLTDTVVHISLHHLCQVRCIEGVVQHKVSRRLADECALPGLPRTPPALAALRAAQWAVSDRQAALFLVLPVQQRITTAERLHVTHSQYAGRRRRALIAQLIDDIADGAHSLGELDLVPALRRRGLPTPTRQAMRLVDGRTRYLDVCWEDIGLALEIDGAAHSAGLEVTFDHFRQNAITLGGDLTLRMNLIGLRLHREEFLDQVVLAHADLTARRRG